jgi:hypothetical protein
VPDITRLQQNHGAARFRQRKGAGHARIACTDDDELCVDAALERSGDRRKWRGRAPKRAPLIDPAGG